MQQTRAQGERSSLTKLESLEIQVCGNQTCRVLKLLEKGQKHKVEVQLSEYSSNYVTIQILSWTVTWTGSKKIQQNSVGEAKNLSGMRADSWHMEKELDSNHSKVEETSWIFIKDENEPTSKK